MHFTLPENKEASNESQKQIETAERKNETSENVSDRESSIESFHTNKSELSIATENELINVDDIDLSDEESWLYKSPKKMTSEEKNVSTEKWLQKNVDDMDDKELQTTRTALVHKLNELKMLNAKIQEKELKDTKLSSSYKSKTSSSDACIDRKHSISSKEEEVLKLANEISPAIKESEKLKDNGLLDVLDVQKIAKLQEESLKQSTSKYLNHSGKRTMGSRDASPVLPVQQPVHLNKPASVEALNTYSDKRSLNSYSTSPCQGIRKQSPFGSSNALNCNQEFHRGSLPNINKGYYSLRTKKSKRPSEPCPLPIHPSHLKISVNGSIAQDPKRNARNKGSLSDCRESRTLPSSYRVNSRRNSSRCDLTNLSPSSRKEPAPFPAYCSTSDLSQRDNCRKFSSPLPSSVSARFSVSPTKSPTKSYSPVHNLRSSSSMECYRTTSQSPSRRLPLSMVQQQSPRRGSSPASPRNGDIKTLKLASKIPSPSSRSGIPVPSACSPRANKDESWNDDCF